MANALMLPAANVQPITEARLLGSVALQRGPIGEIAVSADGATIVATNTGDANVSVVDADTLAIQDAVPVTGEPYAVAFAGDRAFVAAGAATHDVVCALDAHAKTFLASLPLDLNHLSVAATRDGRRLFVGGTGPESADLAIVDVESGRVNMLQIAPGTVDAVHIAPNGRLVYVAASDAEAGSLAVVDPARGRVVGKIPTAAPVRDVKLSSDGSVAYVLGCDPEHGGVVETIDTYAKRVLATAWIGGFPTQFALDADRMYIVDADHIAVWCMITHEITDTITVGALPSCVAASHGKLYVADYSGTISAFAVASASFDDVIDVETLAISQARELQAV